MTSHLALMVLFSLFVSVVFAALMHDDPRDQLRLGARLFGGFVASGLGLSWLLFFLPLVNARTAWLWAPVALYMAAIFYVSSIPDLSLPSGVSDKTSHTAAYLGLSIVVARALAGGLPARLGIGTMLVTIGLTGLYGASDEFHQSFVPGRSSELLDIYADLIGASLGTAICWAWGIIALRQVVSKDSLT